MNVLKRGFRIIAKMLKWVAILLIVLMAVSAIYNTTLSSSSTVTEKLTPSQKAYIAEYFNLQEEIIGDIWPSFDEIKIPVIVYNEEYAFLVGMKDPNTGWLKMPSNEHRGNEWNVVDNDDFRGEPYYRQYLHDPSINPENFTVKVGSAWVSTMQTREFAEVSFYTGFKSELPPVINQVFPYKIFWNLIMGEAESYTSGLIHEAFHGFQGIKSIEKFSIAESIAWLSNDYPWYLDKNSAGWIHEAELLMKAFEAENDTDANQCIREYISVRDQRRKEAELTEEMIEYEKNREWLEGLAKYTELKIGLVAGETQGYEPVTEIKELGDFNNYSRWGKYFKNQLSEVPRAAGRSGESRFYYGGMLQSMILDRVYPDWKHKIFDEDVFLEDLLRESISET
ncbi:hypothetical protein [Rhodohalobacter sp. 8-1]|uniref:hypothetical protein n=1 Tax=Rhodohalobacter sp. 8-1 TaxID=3131972 RepID=UPI0030EF883C